VKAWFANQTDLLGDVCVRSAKQIERRRAVLAKKAAARVGTIDMVELRECIKELCAEEQIPYNGELIDKALRAAIGRRGKPL